MSKPLLLLVDDSPELGLIVAALGRRGGQEVVCRPDVPSAWDFLGERRPDLLLLDLQLPGDSGLELCRGVRADSRLAALPIALFSHAGLSANLAAALEAGVDFLVHKELVSRPADWQRRLGEILPPAHGQPRNLSLRWRTEGDSYRSPTNWASHLNRALRHPGLQGIGREAMRIVLRRGLWRACRTADPDAWMPASDVALRTEPHAPTLPERGILVLVAALAEQVWCLLGAEAAQPFWTALASVVPGSPEFLSH